MKMKTIACFFTLGLLTAAVHAGDAEFFESKIRPVLVQSCYKCHSATTKSPKGGLRLDSRAALLAGGESGPSIVPGMPSGGTFLEALRYKNADLMMPPAGKLPDAAIADFETWIKRGAVWPDDAATATGAAAIPAFDLAARKADHWCWKPIRKPAVPMVATIAKDDIDRFLLAKLEGVKLGYSAPADPATWLRRVTYAGTGLPPTPAERTAFLADASGEAKARVVDRLLASPHYGERWGRHWLDLVRYAESRGHEFDPDIPNIHHYRDYVVRAFNADVPYDDFVREHLAGDRLPQPRLNEKGGNESILGTAHWHLGEEVHSPVDLRQDQADRYDNRIDVFGKTFLGLTLSCARCHDHKFDAISAKDYYAMFALLQGSSFRQVRFDTMEQHQLTAKKLAMLHDAATAKQPKVEPVPLRLHAGAAVVVDFDKSLPTGDEADGPALRYVPAGGTTMSAANGERVTRSEPRGTWVYDRFWDKLTTTSAPDGFALSKLPRAGRTLRTPHFTLNKSSVYALVRGNGLIYAAVCGHTIINGPLHGTLVKEFAAGDDYRWIAVPLPGYKGKRLHLELTAAAGSSFAVSAVIQSDDTPMNPTAGPNPTELTAEVAENLRKAEAALAAETTWESRLSPALWDGDGVDEQVFVRGNPRAPGDLAPRRGPEALFTGERISHKYGSGRYELALQLTDGERNPLFDRVIVNRLWHHLFGRGLVASTDNFGVLGEAPTHPELLDYLAVEFARGGRRIKPFLKRLMLTDAYGQSSRSKPDAADPANLLLHSFRLKQLEGEAIRDAVLVASGTLDRTVGGPSVPIHLTPFLDGRGRPGSGPIDGKNRRSIYLAVRRNFASPFLAGFDTPTPFSTVGRRQNSNVPAQALTLMNDPFVIQKADDWGKRLQIEQGSVEAKVKGIYLAALNREPTTAERQAATAFLADGKDAKIWADFAHAMFQTKEFRFVK